MICLLLIMMTIFINGTDPAEQKLRHSDTLLREEDTNAKTKAWLLMVESGKVDQEELRRITPKSIFIAPLLTSRAGKCKEGYRHDHLGQCVKVIKIDPQVQLELLLQKLNKLYGEKKEEKEEEKELFEVSSGPLHFSLPISNAEEKGGQTDTILEGHSSVGNATAEGQNVPLLNQTKEMEASGAEPLGEEPTEVPGVEGSGVEGSGDGSGDGVQEEGSTTPTLLPEADYLDESDATTSTTEFPEEEFTTTEEPKDSYQNSSVSNEKNVTGVRGDTNSGRIYFPDDDSLRTATKPPPMPYGSRILFPDELPQRQLPDSSTKSTRYQSIPREQFWWLPKNWQIDENQQKSALVKVWSRLPLIHDITYSREAAGFKPPPAEDAPPLFDPQHGDEGFYPKQQQQSSRIVKPFKSSRFQDILLTPRQNFRFQR